MFNNIIENLQSTHLALLVYVVLFIGPILSSILFALTLVFLWINLIIFPLMSSKLKQSYKVYFLGIDLETIGFSIGRLIKKIQKLVADNSNIKILEKVNIHSIQKKITNLYLSIVEGVFNGLIDGLKQGKNNPTNQSDVNWENFKIIKKITSYVLVMAIMTLFISFLIIITCFPVIILLCLIYRII